VGSAATAGSVGVAHSAGTAGSVGVTISGGTATRLRGADFRASGGERVAV
jgi:hypothetical protein